MSIAYRGMDEWIVPMARAPQAVRCRRSISDEKIDVNYTIFM